MTPRAGLLVLPLLVMLSGAVCAETPPEQQKGNATTMDSPFEIRATFDRGLNLKAALASRSSAAQWALHDLSLQPSELVITDAQGAGVTCSDRRDAMKFDNTVRREYFKSVAPKGSLELFQAKAIKKDGRYQLTWGPYHFSGLVPGHYRGRIRWTSALKDYVDEDGTVKAMDGVWLGTVTSAEFAVHLP